MLTMWSTTTYCAKCDRRVPNNATRCTDPECGQVFGPPPRIGFHRGNPLTVGQRVIYDGDECYVMKADNAAVSYPTDTERGMFFDMLVTIDGPTLDKPVVIGCSQVNVIGATPSTTCTCEAAAGRYSTHLRTCPAFGEPVVW
jgi:hypothetical protein